MSVGDGSPHLSGGQGHSVSVAGEVTRWWVKGSHSEVSLGFFTSVAGDRVSAVKGKLKEYSDEKMLHMLRTRGCHINRRRVGAVVMLAVGFSLTFVVFSKSTFQDGKFQDWKEGVVPRKRRLLQ
ncbi:uncharacterized protein LOC112574790 isoform X1 [Pomacea canaliculata]|uniref:uncharacterized protein LOC112574790 isoform X1 n=1 Tax=Pomacea canaliculata TaxID=400727 RepID=UPI000D7295A4|nr:uncharacterized protein LOC112574790 isoform X1 [Pomacea canaliculata]